MNKMVELAIADGFDGLNGTVSIWDFSTANMDDDSRIDAVTAVASVCYANPDARGKVSLFNRLASEGGALPSSSFEYIPMLISEEQYKALGLQSVTGGPYDENCRLKKYGEIITHDDKKYLLTNYRAAVYLYEETQGTDNVLDIRSHYNTEAECAIIYRYYKVFRIYADTNTIDQFIRHRIHLQRLSRRYVSGSKVPFSFYTSADMTPIVSDYKGVEFTTEDIYKLCIGHYEAARANGVKAENARRIIPQAAYTTVWGGFLPSAYANFIKLRTEKNAQSEIRKLANNMKALCDAYTYSDY